MADGQETDKNIEIWKIKKLIKALEAARGNGTSMISLIMPPRDQVSRVTKMLGDEYGTASNIKSRVNRQSVLGAITSAQQRLKLYNRVPPNGLVLYTGTIVTDDGKEKKVTIDLEPFKPINASLYLCDNKFHTEPLNELLESDDKFGFIVMDGNGTLFGTLSGNTRDILHKFSVDLPKKHGRGGQSALRFARLRMEKRHNYVRKTAELATQFYINPATSQPNVSGLILAGSADFKTELSQSELFDQRLQAKILNVVDVSYGGENGFNQAIELSAEILSNVKFIQEKRLIGKYFARRRYLHHRYHIPVFLRYRRIVLEILDLSSEPSQMADGQETDKNIEIWKIKKLIKALEAARGNGTSMISLIMPPRDQVSRVTKMLGDEYGTASNIKSRVNRQSVLGAITSAQQRLKLYNRVPPNGLVLYTGTIVTDDGKEKKVTIDLEPFKPINASLYLCDNKFHTEPLNELLESDDKFGFIVMDGNGTLFGTLSGNTRDILHKFSVDLPKKHGRGGQSALRFARLRMEKRHNYVRKTAELATQFYINPATSQPNVSGLILAGSADFKTELSQSELFDQRLQAKILNVVDVSYGGENGFNQAIELSAEILSNVKFIQEKRLIGKYFEEISQDTGKYVFGVDDTLKALEMGAIETLIVWENLDINRFSMKNSTTGEVVVKHMNKEQEADRANFVDSSTNSDLEVSEKVSLLEWFAEEYRRFGCTLEFVTNKSQEGSQFCRGFGGIGGILRYQLDMRTFDEISDEDYEDE
ncbi:hypothetical protein ZOSMA_350G00120 [Zostera marina]|uniref:eRF1/Pelota-like N-terminal domain-containing protein n=2 Tax=Zostera marina TaxID=29655 RepID=A0A0K9P977_ZOSMR|nr:hypothetical protein ZOSMA_350G00120 [Zostera marina]